MCFLAALGSLPTSTPFPYTTLFRSAPARYEVRVIARSCRSGRLSAAARIRGHGVDRETGHATRDRKSTRLNSSHANISYAVFCLKKKNTEHVTVSLGHKDCFVETKHQRSRFGPQRRRFARCVFSLRWGPCLLLLPFPTRRSSDLRRRGMRCA